MIQDWKLERYRLGELAAPERDEVDRALAADPAVRARLEALETDSRETLTRFAARAVAAEVERRAAAHIAPRRTFTWAPALALAAVAALAFVVLKPHRVDDVVLKGAGPTLRLFRQTEREPERLYDGARVHAHDRVQVSFELAGQRSLVVVSIDGAGNTTLHFPADGNAQAAPGLKALPQSFELDDAPGYERFFLVTSSRGLDSAEVLRAAQALARRADARAAPLPFTAEGAAQTSLTLDKTP